MFWRRYYFCAGKYRRKDGLKPDKYRDLVEKQRSTPQAVMWTNSGRTYWMFRDEFYWDDEGHSAYEITALILEQVARRDRKVQRAVAHMEGRAGSGAQLRQSIPSDVKVFVWNRDGGRCTNCGSQVRLEYDHIIPLAKGGSNTARNIQLLCELCNRSKGVSLG